MDEGAAIIRISHCLTFATLLSNGVISAARPLKRKALVHDLLTRIALQYEQADSRCSQVPNRSGLSIPAIRAPFTARIYDGWTARFGFPTFWNPGLSAFDCAVPFVPVRGNPALASSFLRANRPST